MQIIRLVWLGDGNMLQPSTDQVSERCEIKFDGHIYFIFTPFQGTNLLHYVVTCAKCIVFGSLRAELFMGVVEDRKLTFHIGQWKIRLVIEEAVTSCVISFVHEKCCSC